jgi:hypothetical protein
LQFAIAFSCFTLASSLFERALIFIRSSTSYPQKKLQLMNYSSFCGNLFLAMGITMDAGFWMLDAGFWLGLPVDVVAAPD